ncbi:hypothetical protein EMPG_10714 [Blastomyces silverae]|uniref:Uncharacterized protein n=1 Tax=Blastomyces silverae TaxID=2060906 RepID=A0A0H1B3C1_9EURO|nr:hypothetical protein EMPG_10714 [Blastomyces silverae]
MPSQQSSSSITAFPTTERRDRTESPSVESDKVSRAGTAGSQGAVQPSWPKKRAPTPESATYRKRMCGPARHLVLGEASKSGKSLQDTFVECLELPAGPVPQYSKLLKVITMELMQKYEKEDGKAGMNDIECWGCDSHAREFLSSIGSGVLLETLQKVSPI